MQWLDDATLDLFVHLFTHSDVKYLLLIGAYRDNEVDSSHRLLRTLGALRDTDAKMLEIVLTPLELDDVNHLVSEALHSTRDTAHPLAQLVNEKTGGNPFFVIQFLTALVDEELLSIDHVARTWQWDMNRIRSKDYGDSVVDLMVGKIKRLSAGAPQTLKDLACLGRVVEVSTLDLIHGGKKSRCMRPFLRPSVQGSSFPRAALTAFCTTGSSRPLIASFPRRIVQKST